MQRKPLRSAINRRHPLAAGLVAAWHFDSGKGLFTEKVRNLQVVDQSGTFIRRGTGFGNALVLTSAGSADHVNYGAQLGVPGRAPYTIFAVVKPGPTGASQFQAIMANNSESTDAPTFNNYPYLFMWDDTGKFVNFRSDAVVAASAESAANFPAGRVYRVATTYDGTNLRLYVNGRLEDSDTHPHTVDAASDMKMSLCSVWNHNTGVWQADQQFRGEVYDIRFWTIAMTANQIAELSSDPWGMYRPVPQSIRSLSVPPPTIGVFGSKFNSGFY